jgi:hypothetical protein
LERPSKVPRRRRFEELPVIELLEGFPDGVVAASAKGQVTRRDYDEVLIPKVNDVIARHPRIRCYYELGPQFAGFDAGAAWEDFRLGIEHLAHWERVAVVTDVEWIRVAMTVFRFLVPGQIRLFGTGEAREARQWIAAD